MLILFFSLNFRARKRDVRARVHEEIRILASLDSPYIMRFVGAFSSVVEVVLVTEFLSGGELFERVSSEQFTLTEAECTQFVSQICQGVEFLHKKERKFCL